MTASAVTPQKPTFTVFEQCSLQRDQIEARIQRLRSWALIRGTTIVGPPFVSFTLNGDASIHLPIRGDVVPHAETGLEAGPDAGGLFAHIDGIAIPRLLRQAEEAAAELGESIDSARPFEYHPSVQDLARGTLLIPMAEGFQAS